MQTQGLKRWRVFAPPPPSRMPRADPLARGTYVRTDFLFKTFFAFFAFFFKFYLTSVETLIFWISHTRILDK